MNLLKLYKILKQYSAMFIHSLNWVVIKYLPQVKFTFIEENLGGENTWCNFTFKDVKFYEG